MWTTLPRAGFDTETTGIDVFNDRLVTAAIVIQDGGREERYTWLAEPGVPIPEAAAAVHGITTERARAEGRPAVEVLAEVADMLARHMAGGNPVVAYNASYDITLLESELARHGLPTLADRLGGEVYPVIDPYFLDRHVDRYRKGKRRLENLAAHYGVAPETFHDAEGDVLMTLRVLDRILEKYPAMAEAPIDVVINDQRKAYNEFMDFITRNKPNASSEPRGWPIAR
ncbi:exonuclease domain-containing protein [Trueperella bernardiae]|uniref:Exonuclease domain-containing protein n=1 Tax=Trueperella bernardiae TaxID=59561 RepID=A0AAW6ZJZ6_9ACTO|nr:exonuclease domain-containing protein [Trueperella bernardiae]MCM3907389.1 exonuclease domain-containing protein [Trueperella bernardiae]MDK8601633.1 exonuclease domain-containing protein [Trueperella bernardiae]WIM08390.1 exonuclease domain-containing protein [Trueperella bernardiae]